MQIKTLWSNKWLAVKEMIDKDQGVGGYTYSHDICCEGHKVVVLPYRAKADGSIEYMIRKEVTPCWGMKPVMSSITGGVEGEGSLNDKITHTAIHELKEEAGYTAGRDEMLGLGSIRGIKSSDTWYHLFAVDVTRKEVGKATGDGSELEAKATMVWGSDLDVATSLDPMIMAAYMRLQITLKITKCD